jgi:hypothetical protein
MKPTKLQHDAPTHHAPTTNSRSLPWPRDCCSPCGQAVLGDTEDGSQTTAGDMPPPAILDQHRFSTCTPLPIALSTRLRLAASLKQVVRGPDNICKCSAWHFFSVEYFHALTPQQSDHSHPNNTCKSRKALRASSLPHCYQHAMCVWGPPLGQWGPTRTFNLVRRLSHILLGDRSLWAREPPHCRAGRLQRRIHHERSIRCLGWMLCLDLVDEVLRKDDGRLHTAHGARRATPNQHI